MTRCKFCEHSPKSIGYSEQEIAILSILKFCDHYGIIKTKEDFKGLEIKSILCKKSVIDELKDLVKCWGGTITFIGGPAFSNERNYRINF